MLYSVTYTWLVDKYGSKNRTFFIELPKKKRSRNAENPEKSDKA